MTGRPVRTPDSIFRSSFRFDRIACTPDCARNHGEGIDAGAVATRRALEARLFQDLSAANDRVRDLEKELTIAKRGAVRYAARMVEQAALLCQRLPSKLEALTGIENFAKRLLRLPAPPSRYETEWQLAERDLLTREIQP
jgi:hypothetical protein